METDIFLMVLIFAAGFWYLGAPLMRKSAQAPVNDRSRDNLILQKEEVLLSLKDI